MKPREIEIPADVQNNNCVQDAAARLGEALTLARWDWSKPYVRRAQINLDAWIVEARR